MANLPKIALGAWAWGNDGTFGNNLTAESLNETYQRLRRTRLFSVFGGRL